MSSKPLIRVFVADDEAPARKKLLRLLNQEPDVLVVGEANNGASTVGAIEETKADLLFLDIQMPGMDGFEVVEALEEKFLPKIVFVTAHDDYAIRALDIHAFGYLLKPFDRPRFSKVLEDARRQMEKDRDINLRIGLRHLLEEVRPLRQPRLLVEENGRGVLIDLHRIDWAESDRNYLKLHVESHTYVVRGSIDRLEEKLDSTQFLRINRSSLLRIDFIRELHRWSHGEYRIVMQSGQALMWTRRYLNRHPELLRTL